MTVIVLEVYEALVEAGASKEKAKAAAAAIPHGDGLATKEDISRLEQDVAKLEHVLRSDMSDLENATKANIARLELSTKEAMARLELSTKETMARLEKSMREDIAKLDKSVAVLKLAVFTFQPAIVALLVKLIFFP